MVTSRSVPQLDQVHSGQLETMTKPFDPSSSSPAASDQLQERKTSGVPSTQKESHCGREIQLYQRSADAFWCFLAAVARTARHHCSHQFHGCET